ncbi:sulfatase-like hydrolase/transferase [uncultured Dysgonomonas sp.]|uniref:LTA synthase family protein n=1 Tax=uncultured Dysgonomonas sp. TaxID=206096 RepID=UPI00280483C5|nr:sulfatase-like hydrolase/transferase [uncultured Dysgonomonas sp.]
MKKIKISILYVLSIHIMALIIMSLQRTLLLLTNLQHIESVTSKASWIFSALLRGIWFDNVIASYISALPLVVICILGLFNKVNKITFNSFNVYYILIYTVVFAIGFADIPYFAYFFKHLNSSIFNWNEESSTTTKMIFEETSYYIYMGVFLLVVIAFGYLVFKLSKRLLKLQQENIKGKEYFIYIPTCIILAILCILGIRGRFGYNPIKTSQAYFCNNSFLNQLGINPSFYFLRDVIESSKTHHSIDNVISEKEAISYTQKFFGLNPADEQKSPIARYIKAESPAKDMNVVVILMESMSADLLKVTENGKEITPFLNQLIKKSYYFDHFYSAGTHTNHGILATLYGLPALFDKNMMKNVTIPLCQGLPNTLQEQNYKTMFFMPHESQYDNMNAFLLENGFEEIYSQENYPPKMRKNSFGVADDFLLSYSLNKINEKAPTSSPFFATILTVSNHPPYIVPEKFEKVSTKPEFQIVAFADDAIRQFFADAEKQSWFKNTIFVLLGDHGKIVGTQTYEMPLSLNHIPLIIYSPAFTDMPTTVSNPGGQVDVFPTIMDLLDRSYMNNTFGVDMFKTKRPYMFFSSDNALGCIDEKYFYTYNFKSKIDGLYEYSENSSDNLLSQFKQKADSMNLYSAAMFQTANYMLKHELTRVKK